MRSVAALTLPLLLVASASAAELRIGLSADVTTMDPHFIAAQPNLTAQHHVFDTLVRTDERSRPFPGIATWRTPDALTWEFTLRQGVKFHDGSELTAEDVAYSLERPLKIKGSPGGFQTYVRPIVAREVVDRYTLRLKTAAPYGALLQDLAEVMIVSKKAAAQATGVPVGAAMSMPLCGLRAWPLKTRRRPNDDERGPLVGASSCKVAGSRAAEKRRSTSPRCTRSRS